jgi:hypothetical protein
MTFEQARAALIPWQWKDSDKHARCPAHQGKKRSLSVWVDENGIARFKCHSHQCRTGDIVAALGAAPAAVIRAVHLWKPRPASEKSTRELAARLWSESREARGTIAQDYLFGRRIAGEIPASIRFHPKLWHSPGIYFPGMVAAVEDVRGQIVAIHRTFLKPDGTGKAEVEPNKKALGSYGGCAVHLSSGAPELVICEGIETGLSILQTMGLHAWAALGTCNLAQIELPKFVREIIIAADHDEPGMKAASIAADAYRASGYQVEIVSPRTEKADWNDVLRRC